MMNMESHLGSWSEEPPISTELSPPISPSAPFYPRNSLNNEELPTHKSNASRAQLAAQILKSLEEETVKYEYDNLSYDQLVWNEESVNLELFSDLDVDFPAPLTPDSQEFDNQSEIEEWNNSPPTSPPHSNLNTSNNNLPHVEIDLTAEFHSILSQLHSTGVLNSYGEVEDLSNQNSSIDENSSIEEWSSEYNSPGPNSIEEEEEELIEEVRSENNLPYANSNAEEELRRETYFPYGNANVEEELRSENTHLYANSNVEEEDELMVMIDESELGSENGDESERVSENILDALLKGDLERANEFVLAEERNMRVKTRGAGKRKITARAMYEDTDYSEIPPPKKRATSNKKGNKPEIEDNVKIVKKKGRLPKTVDKVERKKEQNKTAAVRYREKMRAQKAVISEEEKRLEEINNKLQSERDDLHRQISLIKQLLREVVSAKRSKNSTSVSNRKK